MAKTVPSPSRAGAGVIGYIRVSTDMPAPEDVSLDAQRKKIRAYCPALDLHLVRIYADEGQSAKSLGRPELKNALSALERGDGEILLVCKLDRLTRSVKDLGHLVKKYFSPGQLSLLSIGDSIDKRTASGRLVLNVLGSVAQWEREAISERTREAMRHLITQVVHIGATPYGAKRVSETDAHGVQDEEPFNILPLELADNILHQKDALLPLCERLPNVASESGARGLLRRL